ncbi:hypothetical protein ACP3WD_24060, partial [Salmonella enterica]|uniref:hypothetical protein n=1 Tax=Salmonella enterica TaxID=28901 RepID=UPI003CEA7A25
TAKEKTDLELERKTFWEKPPSKFLGEPIIKWANAHPEDPRVPEALYRVLKLPRWTYATAIGSKYSKEAYKILHEQHPKSTWTKKAVCWY